MKMSIAKMSLAVMALFSFAGSAAAGLTAYKVERLVSPHRIDYSDDPVRLGPPLAQIEIGAVEKNGGRVSPPPRESLDGLVVVGTQGLATASSFCCTGIVPC